MALRIFVADSYLLNTRLGLCFAPAETPLPESDAAVFRKPNFGYHCGYHVRLLRDTKCKSFLSKAKSLHFPLTPASRCHTIASKPATLLYAETFSSLAIILLWPARTIRVYRRQRKPLILRRLANFVLPLAPGNHVPTRLAATTWPPSTAACATAFNAVPMRWAPPHMT